MSFEDIDNLQEYINNSKNPYLKEFFIDDVVINNTNYVEPSKFKISTMTYTANIGVKLNLQQLFDSIEITNGDYPKILSCEYVNNDPKGLDVKKKKKYFANQLTIRIQFNSKYKVNMKVFNNGKIGITGCKEDHITKNILEYVIEYFKQINEKKQFIIDDEKELKLYGYDIVLINSDFVCGFEIKRDILYSILKKMNLYVSYEPDIYPGVKICFFYNKVHQDKQLGICHCNKKCKGKGYGDEINKCKKITISVFQSGSVIITGAKNNYQKDLSYKFINNIIKKHYSSIKKDSLNKLPKIIYENGKNYFFINKQNIKNYHLKNQHC